MSKRLGPLYPLEPFCGVFCWFVKGIVAVAEAADDDCVIMLELVIVVPVEEALDVVVDVPVLIVLVLVDVVDPATWRMTEEECESEPLVPVTVMLKVPAALAVVVTVIFALSA
jgi:hypothetical protein